MCRKIAIIPARGGSKRIPRKNIRPFRGRPIIEWSISAALDSRMFDVVMVSTDDPEISDIARSCGAEAPFIRSTENSGDHATTMDVVHEVLTWYETKNDTFDIACCLYPTAPFVQARDLVEGAEYLLASDFDVIMPVAAYQYPIWRSLSRYPTGKIVLNFPENVNVRSQDLTTAYHDAGQWYWFRVDALKRDGVLIGTNSGSIILPGNRVQDIDTEDDWLLAELKHQRAFGSTEDV